MISRTARAAYYFLARPFMAANGLIYRTFRRPYSSRVLVHLGPGREKYINGWINADANLFTAKNDLWIDLRNRLPFHDGTVDAFYSHHVIEHLPDMRRHFDDCFRCLKRGGLYRIGGPNGDAAIKKFVEGDNSWFGDWPDKRRSIGGRFENFIFCRQEHLTILTYSYLKELLEDAGFVEIKSLLPVRETLRPDLFAAAIAKESERDFETPHTLIVECVKP